MNKLSCDERDSYLLDETTGRVSAEWEVESSLTDLWGEFGEPRIETTWGRGVERVRDVRHPAPENAASRADVRPCEHYYWTVPDDLSGFEGTTEALAALTIRGN